MVLAAALVVALLGPHASLSAPPRSLVVGQAWRATLVVRPAPRLAPTVLARPTLGRQSSFRATKTGRGRYRVRLVLPRAGKWRLSARVGKRSFGLALGGRAAASAARVPAPGATAFRVCGGAAIPYPQYALAVGFGSAWVACVRQSEVQRISLATGQVTARIRVPVPVWSIAAGEGAVWAVALHGSVVYRIAPGSNRVTAEIGLGTQVPYRGPGPGRSGSPTTRLGARPRRSGDEPARRARSRRRRPGGLRGRRRLHLGAEPPRELARPDRPRDERGRPHGERARARRTTSAAERIASLRRLALGDRAWPRPPAGLTCDRRGARHDGDRACGVDVRSDGANLWLVSYDAAAEPRGDPVAGAVLRIAADGSVSSSVAPTRRLFANGVAAADGALWLLDSVAGLCCGFRPEPKRVE